MANEFKVKNALQILKSHPISNISNSSTIFDDEENIENSLATASAIKEYFGDIDVSGSFVGALPDLTDVSDDLAPGDNNKYLVFNTTTNLWEAGTSDSLWKVDSSIISPTDPTINIGLESMEIITNGGEITIVDMKVTDEAPIGTPESYSFNIDGDIVMKIYGESDGAGGVQNTGMVMNGKYQYIGDPTINGCWRFYVDDTTTDLIYEKLVDGSWVEGGKFSV